MLDAVYRPPAEQGQVFETVQSLRPQAIVLIDGAFASVPSVRHKEILWALSRGIAMIGASSLGALRAAELAGFGMRGHGLIYRWFRKTLLADDDEVAVAMAPPELGAGALGDALIDMRITFRRAERAGILPADLHIFLVETARAAHFLERSYGHAIAQARAKGPAHWNPPLAALETWMRDHAFSQKRRDAEGLLRMIGAELAPVQSPPHDATPFTPTEAFVYDLHAAGLDPRPLLKSEKGG